MTGTVEQLAISFLVVLGYMLLLSVAKPFKDEGDDYFGQVCRFALTAMFFFLLVLKFGVLAYLMDDMLSEQLRERYQFDLALVTVGMVGAIMLAVLLATVMAGQQIVQAARMPTIRLQITKAAPDLPLAKEHTWHMFLSQCARLPFEQLSCCA